MAIQHVVDGPQLIKFGTSGAEVSLGYTHDGARIRIQESTIDVHSDDWGGAGGAPADRQLLGLRAFVTCEMTKYDRALVEALTSFIKGGTAGTMSAFGTLKRQDTKFGTLILDGTTDRTFTVAFPTQSYEVNSGTRFSTAIVTFECWLNSTSGLLLFA